MKNKFVTSLVVATACGLTAVTPVVAADASKPQSLTSMVAEFERTYGNKHIPEGESTPRSRCVSPSSVLQRTDPKKFEEMRAERLECEVAMNRILTQAEGVGWSTEVDKALSTLATTYSYAPARVVLQEVRAALVDQWRQKVWSPDMEHQLGAIAGDDQTAKGLLESKRRVFLAQFSPTTPWSPAVENKMQEITRYSSQARQLLNQIRDAYLAQWKEKWWSVTMEEVIGPMAKTYTVPGAVALLDEKRAKELDRLIEQPFTDSVDEQLALLAQFYQPAQQALTDLRAGKTVEPTTTPTSGVKPTDKPTPGTSEEPQPADPPSRTGAVGNEAWMKSAATYFASKDKTTCDTTCEAEAVEAKKRAQTMFWSPDVDQTLEKLAALGDSEAASLLSSKRGDLAGAIVGPIVALGAIAAALYFAWFGI